MAILEERKSKLQAARRRSGAYDPKQSTQAKIGRAFARQQNLAKQAQLTGVPQSQENNREIMRLALSMRLRDLPTLVTAAISPIARLRLARAAAQQAQSQTENEEDENPSQQSVEERRKKMRAAMRRGGIVGANGVAAALDSTGIGFLLGFFVHLGTFGELLLEMFYGRHVAKGKSKIIPPISWEPLPLLPQMDPNAVILQAVVVACIIALVLAVLSVGLGVVCIAHDYVQLLGSPLKTAADIIKGGSGMCLGGIISSFGL